MLMIFRPNVLILINIFSNLSQILGKIFFVDIAQIFCVC